ncbi:TPA: ATP-dependent Clp protease ATP-binding subunit, partial [Streptococcus pyogenes]|nr:ATP-dependent Clp protease ATP-binding subunit [Streptococcus pyogenes]
ESLEEIVDLMLAEVNQTTAKKGISLTITDDAKAHLIDLGYNHAMGARPLRRIIEQEIRDRITDYYLDHPEVKKLQAILKEGQLVIRQNDQ